MVLAPISHNFSSLYCKENHYCITVYLSTFQLLSTSLNTVGEEQYITDLGQLFGEQLQLYKDYPEEKVKLL